MAKLTNTPMDEAWLTERDKAAGVVLRKVLVEANVVASDKLCGELCPHHGEYGNCQLSDPSAYGEHLAEVEEGEPDENGQRHGRYVRSSKCIAAEKVATKRDQHRRRP